jgi:protein-disulfide isomerase
MRTGQLISSIAVAAFVSVGAAALASPSLADSNVLTPSAIAVAQAAATPQPATASQGPRRENGDMVIGAANAPVTIIEYASLTCPHCARFHTETLPKLKSDYVDTGKVKFIFRDYPLDRVALAGAMIAQCAGPERYFTFLDVMFRQQASWTKGGEQEAMASLRRLARLGGMSDAQIDDCLKDKKVQDAILATSMAGQQQFQVKSTPTLIINGERHSGALPFDELEKILKPLIKS